MHEYAITKELLRIVRETAKKEGLVKVRTIFLNLGLLTGYEKESMLYYFNELKIGGGFLAGAELIIKEVSNNEITITSIKGNKNED